MKLRNKLIPFASVFATVATLAPVSLTSCGSKNGMVNLTDGNYAPTTKKAVTEGYVASEELATELWMSEVNDKPQTLIDDMLWTNALEIKGWADINGINVTSCKGLVKDVKVQYVTVKIDGVDTKIPTLSMTYSFTVECNWYVTGGSFHVVRGSTNDSEPNADTTTGRIPSALYKPSNAYYYDYGVSGKIVSSRVFESTWKNIPIQLYDREAYYKELAQKLHWSEETIKHPTIHSDWHFAPVVSRTLLMDTALIDWSYSAKWAHTDTFTYLQDGKEDTKNYSSSFDRTYDSYVKLMAGPEPVTQQYTYNRGCDLLNVERFSSYYLSDLTKEA